MKLNNLLLLALAFTNRMADAAIMQNSATNLIYDREEKHPVSSFYLTHQTLMRSVQSVAPPAEAKLVKKVYVAITNADADTLNDLLDRYEFDVNKHHNHDSLLNVAVKLNHATVVDVLIANGANVYWEGNGPTIGKMTALSTPIAHAITNGDIDILNAFLKYGFDLNHKFTDNITPLYILSVVIFRHSIPQKNAAPIIPASYLQILDLFIKHGADINSQAEDKPLPLQLAIRENHLTFAKALLERGAKVTDEMIDYAKKYRSNEIVTLLQKYQAKQSVIVGTWVCGVLAFAGTCYKAAMGYSFYKTPQQASTKKSVDKKPGEKFQSEREAKRTQAKELLTQVYVTSLTKNNKNMLVPK